jgi:hypothetical protein
LPVETAHYKDDNISLRTTGVEKVSIGGKYRLTSDNVPFVASAQVKGFFPVCDEEDKPPLSDCQIDADMRIIISKGFLPVIVQSPLKKLGAMNEDESDTIVRSRLFTSLEIGYQVRAEKPSNEIPYLFEVGFNVWKRLWFKGMIDGVESKPFDEEGEEEDFSKWTASLIFSKDPATRSQEETPTLELGYGEVFTGKNTGEGEVFFLKLAYQF